MIELNFIKDNNGIVLPAFTITTLLGDTHYTLDFRWNTRSETWVMDISDVAGVLLLAGVTLHVGVNLFDFPGLVDLPPGAMVAFDSTGQDLDPGLVDLGERVKLFYLTPAEIGR